MLDKEFYNETYELFENTYGTENEIRICIEEMSELTKALCKYLRYNDRNIGGVSDEKRVKAKEDVIEECADVIICAEQIKRIFGKDEVEKIMDYKIQRGRNIVDNDIKSRKK